MHCNLVVNCHSPGMERDDYIEMLHEHRRTNDVLYAIMDYDQSLQLPESVSLKDCRRPASEADAGNGFYRPTDLDLGQPYYNPFAWDVGAMGILFRVFFVVCICYSLS